MRGQLPDVEALLQELNQFWRDYAGAFQTGDLHQLLPAFDLPLVITTRERTHVFETLAAIDANNSDLVAFYRAQGVARVVANIVVVEPMLRDFIQVHVAYHLLDSDDGEIVNWTTVYGLKHKVRGWSIHSILAQDELDAWAERGIAMR